MGEGEVEALLFVMIFGMYYSFTIIFLSLWGYQQKRIDMIIELEKNRFYMILYG